MWKCHDCGCKFVEPAVTFESRGEFWGVPCSEEMYVCPRCGCDDSIEEFDEDQEDDYEQE